ncbi:histidine kinase [Pseudoflavitalea sp. X16]|uniref:sensor histidine kinase n=1 Tax=Paraflavitalea devenefica TaxID=2716334 RepID=UPI00141E6501|nr:histidine kinase [Paraflavitalea devenefica]NII23742.1 histidine kinase [Paraflavitalea devenefica]
MFANLKALSDYKNVSFVFKLLSQKRFSLLKVFWIVLIIHIILMVLAVMSMYTFPSKNQPAELQGLFNKYSLISTAAGLAFYTFFYYFAVNHFYHLIANKKGLFHYFTSSILVSFILWGYYLADGYLRPDLQEGAWSPAIALVFFLVCFLLSAVPCMLIAFIASHGDEKKQRKVLEEQKMQLEVEKSNANLNFLKAQINPHFLHNTLNFLYAKSLPYSPELSEGILTLSDIMRYALSEGNLKNGKAALKDEIEHLRNVIRIHQLRYNNNLHVNFEVNGIVNGTTIIPFVLITIVENAFKHGDLKSTEYPIDIRLTVDDNSLQFYCRNKKKAGPKELSTGIGLDNIKKRLDLAYKDQYTLDIKDEHELYTTQLIIHTL